MNGLAACLLLAHATAAQQGLQVLHDAHCVEARASFLGAHLQETNGTARVALDLQLTALSTCDERTKVLVDASAEDALADGDDGLEVCVLWVSMTGAERRTSRCYGGGQPARVEWDLTAALRQRYRLVAWPARGAWPGAFAGASHTLSFDADLGAAAFPPPHLIFTAHEHGATLAGQERRACDPLHLYAGTQHRDTDENWYHFTFGMLLPLAARLSERDDACAAVGRRPPPTVLYVRRCGFRRTLVEAVGTDDFRLVDLSGKPPPQNMSLEVLPRMDYWSDQAHALLELLARGERGRAWLHERFVEPTAGTACVFQTRAARPGRRPFAIANFEALAEAYASKSRCKTRVAPDPTGLTLAEQVQAHADASLLVAPHGVALCRNQIVAATDAPDSLVDLRTGAGLAHAAWLPEGTCVVEVLPKSKSADRQLRGVAAAFGLRTARIYVDDDDGGEVALEALVGAVEACAAPPKPEWQRSADAHPNDLGRLVVPDVT